MSPLSTHFAIATLLPLLLQLLLGPRPVDAGAHGPDSGSSNDNTILVDMRGIHFLNGHAGVLLKELQFHQGGRIALITSLSVPEAERRHVETIYRPYISAYLGQLSGPVPCKPMCLYLVDP